MFDILQKVVLKIAKFQNQIVDYVLAQIGKASNIHVLGDYQSGIDTGLIEIFLFVMNFEINI